MKGLITHERTQAVTASFVDAGHDFRSNDIQDCAGPYPMRHLKMDVFHALHHINAAFSLDFLGMHPDCTYLTNAGIRWLSSRTERYGYVYSQEWSDFNGYHTWINPIRWEKMELSCLHFKSCYSWLKTVGRGYIENPKMHPYAARIIGIPSSQYFHPYYFGTPQMKETHIWIIGLPNLEADNMLTPPKDKEESRKWQDVWMCPPGPERANKRSATDPNVARAMVDQWGKLL